MDSTLLRFRDKFIEEAHGLLDRLEKDLLELENKPDDKELIESAFRAMHTIKGVSGMYGFDFISEFTHHMESIYQAIREKRLQFDKEIFDATFSSVDHIRKLLADEKLTDVSNKTTHGDLMKVIQSISAKGHSGTPLIKEETASFGVFDEGLATWHIIMKTNEMQFFRGISLTNIFKELSSIGQYQITRLAHLSDEENDTWSIFLTSEATEDEINDIFLFIEDDCTITNLAKRDIFNDKLDTSTSKTDEQTILNYVEDSSKPKAAPETAKETAKESKTFTVEPTANAGKPDVSEHVAERQQVKRISVDSVKLDNLMFLVSELITVNSQLSLATRDRSFNPIRPYVEKIDTLSKYFRNNALEIRLVPLSDTVLRFQRLIRDLSKHLNKKVDFKTQGTDTELDKNTIDQLAEPLMHIIRNCIDHGIETPETRVAKGKSENGTIKLSAYHSGNYVFISIADDGSGIDTEKVRQKAIDKGILKTTDKVEKKDIFELIFMPGFSTAQSLTEVSGRGVGMDVVRRRITDLRGEVIVDSEFGQGTSFTLKLQQSLAIIDTLLFKVDSNFFTVPISDIEICSQINIAELDKRKHTATIPFNDHLIPFVDLRTLFHITGEYSFKSKIIVLKNNERQIAILSDSIVGEHQAVLKPLGKSFKDQNFISSASQLGDGNMAFMIDTNALFKETLTVN